MNASPIRKAWTAFCRIRETSAGARMPLSVTTKRSAGMRGSRSRGVLQADLEGAQVAVVDANQRRLELQASQFVAVMHLDQHRHARAKAMASNSCISADSSADTMSRMASPIARTSNT